MKAPTTYWTTSSRGTMSAEFLPTVAASSFRTRSEKYLANLVKADGAAAAADERPVAVYMVAGMFEHGQAEALGFAL